MSVAKMIMEVGNRYLPAQKRANTLRELVTNLALSGLRFNFAEDGPPGNRNLSHIDFLTQFRYHQVYDVFPTVSKIYTSRPMNPPANLAMYESAIRFIDTILNLPVPNELITIRDSTRAYLNEVDERHIAQEELKRDMRARKDARNYVPLQTPNSYKIYISIINDQGHAYGRFYVWLPKNSPLSALRPLIEAELGDIYRIPHNAAMRVIFAGRVHPLDTPIEQVAENPEEIVLHIALRH
jgi:hypothetical protein